MTSRPHTDQASRDHLEDLGVVDNDRTEDLRSSTNHDGDRECSQGLVFGPFAQGFSEAQSPSVTGQVNRPGHHLTERSLT